MIQSSQVQIPSQKSAGKKRRLPALEWKELRNWFSFLFATIGATLLAAKMFSPLDIWQHGDWIQFTIAIGTIFIGGAAIVVSSHQNKILESQNSLIQQQNDYLANQRHLNDLLIKQELNRENERIKTWSKNTFRNGGNSPGILQINGASLRKRFPNSIELILDAYDELCNEEPQLKLPNKTEFLKLMQAINSENSKWPAPYGKIFHESN